MNENEEKVALTFRPELTFTIEKTALQDFFDALADKIAEKVVEKGLLLMLKNAANQEEPAAAAESAADQLKPLKDDPNEPWGDEPETEEGADE